MGEKFVCAVKLENQKKGFDLPFVRYGSKDKADPKIVLKEQGMYKIEVVVCGKNVGVIPDMEYYSADTYWVKSKIWNDLSNFYYFEEKRFITQASTAMTVSLEEDMPPNTFASLYMIILHPLD